MADIFISYARDDLNRIRPFVRLLEDAGLSVLWDRKTPTGIPWREYISKTLDEALCVVVVWSEYAVNSRFVIEEADDGNKREILIPVLIDDVPGTPGLQVLPR